MWQRIRQSQWSTEVVCIPDILQNTVESLMLRKSDWSLQYSDRDGLILVIITNISVKTKIML